MWKRISLSLAAIGLLSIALAQDAPVPPVPSAVPVSYNGEIVSQVGKKKTYNFHVGHINYKDISTGELKKIDETLVKVNGGWTFIKHSFHPFLPDFADGTASFRDVFEGKDQTITYKALAGHIPGVAASDSNNPRFGVSGVKYDSAFGLGKDLWYYFSRSRMIKVAAYQNPNLATEDAVFEWEVTFPKNRDNVTVVKDFNNRDIDSNADINLRQKGAVKVGGDNGTILGSPEAWDSEGNVLQVQADIIHRAGKLILRKVIPLAELKKAKGTAYTDVTTTYYVGSGDGVVYKEDTTSWASLRGSGNGTTAGHFTSDPYTYLTWGFSSPTYFGRRHYFPTDTSGITDTDTIDSATFNYTNAGCQNDNATVSAVLVSLNSSVSAPPVVGDWNLAGSTSYGRTAGYSSCETGTLKTITINAAGLLDITKTGTTYYAIREGEKEFDNVSPANATNTNNRIYMSEAAGTTNDPYLSIVTSATASLPRTIIIDF